MGLKLCTFFVPSVSINPELGIESGLCSFQSLFCVKASFINKIPGLQNQSRV